MIDPITTQKIKDAADIIEVVSDYVHLVRRGANYMGLCPFHNERTPSFSVNKRKNFCFCFSCKKGGSPVNFIMEKEGLSYHDALLHLAKKYGIEVQERELTDEEKAELSERESMLIANDWAMQKMETDLFETEEGQDIGLQYFYQRGVTEEAIRKFHLGYAIDKGDNLVSSAKLAGYNLDVLKKLGLVGTSKEGRDYDRFRGRVIFPIINSAGKVIAFGGRDLKGGLAKYINSPESALYKKSNELYGIYQARSEMVREDKCYLVEGYLDVIGMWQSGLKNTVASSGTALTDGQIALIHRFTENITLIYDGDDAGIKASLRGIDMLLSHKMKVKVLLLPDGDDPDSFARKHSPEDFRKYIAEHETDIIRFKARVLLADIQKDPQRRIDAVNSVVASLAHIPDPVSRDIYIQECSSILGISEDTVAKSVARVRGTLVEKWKRERTKRDYPVNSTLNNDDTAYGESTSRDFNDSSVKNDIENSNKTTTNSQNNLCSPLFPLEKKVIEYCVKYGYLEIGNYLDEEGKTISLSVLDFVREELEADNISFSIDTFKKIFTILKDMKGEYSIALEKLIEKINKDVERKRKDGMERIRRESLSFAEAEKSEKSMEKKLLEYRNDSIRDFSKDFPGRQLVSHEDDNVRDMAFDLVRERHHLSQIYYRDNNVVEREEDKLDVLVPRAIIEWKNELLNMKLKLLFETFREVSNKGDHEAEKKLQQEITSIMKMRSQVAKDIGDRIISPPTV